MSDSDRGKEISDLRTFWKSNSFGIIAAILVFCVGWTAVSITYLFNGPYEASEPVRPNSGTHQFYQAECEAAKSRNWVVATDFEKPKNHQRQDDEKNLDGPIAAAPDFCNMAAQYRSAEAAEASNIVSWVTAGLTLIGVIFLWRTMVYTKGTLKAANDTNKTTREIGQAQSRAYLDASGCRIYNGETQIAIIVENTGQTPANTFGLRYTVKLLSAGDEQWYGDFSGVKNWKKGRWASVGAGESTTVGCLTNLHEFDIFSSQYDIPKKVMCIKGVVYYQNVFGQEFMSQFVFGGEVPINLTESSPRDPAMGNAKYRRLSRPPGVKLIAHQLVEDQSEQP